MTLNDKTDPGEGPLWLDLGLESGPVFAVMHPTSEHGSVAVLICPPFGWREECAHRGLAVWARELAAAGFPALRLDLPGTRNSAGGPADRTPANWIAAISAAAAWLCAHEHADRVTLLGVELGGLLGWSALAAGAPIDDMITWAVRGDGRAAVRELRMHAAVVAARHAAESPPGATDASEADDAERTADLEGAALEVVGYVLEEAALRELAALTPGELPIPGPGRRRVLLLGSDAQPVDPALADRLRGQGVDTTVAPGPGYGALMEDPQFSEPPRETIASTISWLRRGSGAAVADATAAAAPATASGRDGSGAPATAGAAEVVQLPTDSGRVRERALILHTRCGAVFAVVTEPSGQERAPACAVLLNAGSVSHAGPNRAWVELARHWAGRGVTTVRVDFPGIGDSRGDAERYHDTNFYYEPELTEQTLAVLDGLAQLGLPPRFAVAGLCSGAYWALHAALRDPRVCGAMLLNLWAFYFSPALVLERAPGDALARLRHGGISRLVRGDFSRARVARALRSINPGSMVSGARRPIERSQSADIEADLDRLGRSGVALTLLFGLGEPLRHQLERQGVIAELPRWPNVRVEQIPSRDHMFRSLTLQRHVHQLLDSALARSVERAGEIEQGHGGAAVAAG